ncbi:hypothetical protein KXV70_003825 [Aspergillus fumigatus]|nr:hypothetical protein KXX30_008897 [Aspergillus fumigatus]KAH1377363.1 hypothetical protein KXX50_009281 [Aspergillus fumigatus]KAH1679083.1 hypothetical protein KXX46_008835 [Aspergillus fumigatus]KAH1873705.1 hypothetical protein KXW95_005976 [Aspergillus fumigatus]KAH2132980.1 hypothetical protein KXV35_009238 [Aspergillus fumigatus]
MAKDLTLVLSEEQAWLGQARPEEALPICIAFAHGDQDNPPKWDKLQQWYITFFVSVLNALTHRHRRGFHVSFEVTTLCVSLYVLDFAIGPVFLAPLSEYLGRQLVYVVSWFLLFIFSCRLPSPPTSAPSSSAVSWQVVPVWTARYQTYSALALAGAPPVREPDVAAAGLRVGVGSTVLLHGMSDAAAESAGS